MTDATTSEMRICRICAERKISSEFRLRSRDGNSRMTECRQCHNFSEKLRRAAKKSQAVAMLVRQLNTKRRSSSLEKMATAILNDRGGLDSFMREFRKQYLQALSSDPMIACRYQLAVLRLVELASYRQS